jgi:hypothetical protein
MSMGDGWPEQNGHGQIWKSKYRLSREYYDEREVRHVKSRNTGDRKTKCNAGTSDQTTGL